MPATAGAFSFVTVNPGRTATARAMNSRTASYWPSVDGSGWRDGRREVLQLDPRQPARVRRRGQARDHVLLLARDAQHGPARDDDADPRAGADEGADVGRSVDDLLEVVEQEQHPPLPDRAGDDVEGGRARALGDADRAGDRRQDEVGARDRLEGDEPDPVGVLVGRGGRQLEREPRLAGPARSGERQELASRRGAPRRRRAPGRAPRTTSPGWAGCWGGRRASGSAGSRPRGPRSRAGPGAPAGGPSGGGHRGRGS